MTIVFGSDEWCLNDVQISSCHRDRSISTEREKEKTAQIALTNGDLNYLFIA